MGLIVWSFMSSVALSGLLYCMDLYRGLTPPSVVFRTFGAFILYGSLSGVNTPVCGLSHLRCFLPDINDFLSDKMSRSGGVGVLLLFQEAYEACCSAAAVRDVVLLFG